MTSARARTVEVPTVAELERLETSSLRARARESIRASIVAGELEEGRFYPIVYLADRLGVSVTPVREALFDLGSVGLVEVIRSRGFRVPRLTDHDLDELFELRQLVELPAVVRLARQRSIVDPSQLRELAQDIERQAEKGDLVAFLLSDRSFHLLLLASLGNRRLVELVASLRDQTRLHGLKHMAETGDLAESAQEHMVLLEAMVDGNADASDYIMRRHLLHTRGLWAGRRED
jgi:DNA-binding GntR family transcriptional regulator